MTRAIALLISMTLLLHVVLGQSCINGVCASCANSFCTCPSGYQYETLCGSVFTEYTITQCRCVCNPTFGSPLPPELIAPCDSGCTNNGGCVLGRVSGNSGSSGSSTQNGATPTQPKPILRLVIPLYDSCSPVVIVCLFP